jgi:TRAP transporter TAXI family solute receptor
MNVVMQAMGWTEADFAYVADFGMAALPEALCGGEIDAAVFIVAHPNLTVEDMVTSCDALLVPVDGPVIDELIAENPYYFAFEIPAGTYPDQPISVPDFALAATLVTSSRTAPAVVYELTKAVFENFDAFRDAHPAFANLEKSKMTTEGLTAPLHEGARRYFEEAGIAPY